MSSLVKFRGSGYRLYAYHEILKTKDTAFVAFKKFKALTEKKTGKKIKQFHIDQGGEFLNGEFKHFLNVEGILVHPSAPHTHQQNGRAERLNRTLTDKAEALCHMACIPVSWWEFVYKTAIFVYNCTPMKRLDWKSPNEVFNNKQPDVSYLRVFGCGAYVFIPKNRQKNKLSLKREAMIFIGYEARLKSYLFMDASNMIHSSPDATFDEQWFPKCKNSKPFECLEPDKQPRPSSTPRDDADSSGNDYDNSSDDGTFKQPSHPPNKPDQEDYPSQAPRPRQTWWQST